MTTQSTIAIPAPFLSGFNLEANPHLWSSDNWLLHQAGQAFNDRGYPLPLKAWKSRGFSVAVQSNDNDFIIKFTADLKTCTVERK